MYWSMDSDTIFVCLEAVWNNEVFDGDFVPCKNDRKDLYVQRKIFIINAIDQGVLATSKPLAVNNVPIWTTLMASHHILHVWRNQGNSKTRLVHQRYLHEVLYHIYGGGGASLCPPPPTIQTSINFSRLWGAVVSWLVFNKWLSNLAIF